MIRALKSADIPVIKDIYIKSNCAAGLNVPEDHFLKDSLQYIHETLHKCENTVFEKNGRVLGIISVSHDYVEGLFVIPDHWNESIGSELLKHVLNIKKDLRLQVYESNTNAIKFYKKHGFEITGGGICQMTGLPYFAMDSSY
ncbi:MAG TPA: GNAT family N-acetyltransferase [bacterium]|nr:GNAT family N-acetyltransferase [bacterium]